MVKSLEVLNKAQTLRAQEMPNTNVDPGGPNHAEYNHTQWGKFLRPDGDLESQRRTGKWLVDNVMFRVARQNCTPKWTLF